MTSTTSETGGPGEPEPGGWSAASWRRKPNNQPLDYPSASALEAAVTRLSQVPPLVTSWEVEALKNQLAEAAVGKRFLLQGGDCAETFAECDSSIVANKLKILLQMSLLIIHGGNKRVIRVGRFAGQYAKPRSSPTETRNGVTLPSYRGDGINEIGFTDEARALAPERLLEAHARAAITLNFIRSLSDGGFADLYHPENWDLGFVEYSEKAREYQRLIRDVGTALAFMVTLTGVKSPVMRRVDFFTSHEGLNLYYEQAQTRQVPRRTGWYDLSAHMLWLGDRTRNLGGAHIEFFRGIANPIGVKVGPSMSPSELVNLLKVVDPNQEPGRVTLIHRFGVDNIARCLPPLVEAVQREGRTVLWCCDPMHGNTRTTDRGLKTRRFDDILGELSEAFDIHAASGGRLAGVHFELTGDNVTECVGGARGLDEAGLERAYRTTVDPRLNYEQSLEMAMLIARRMAKDT